MAPAGRCCAAEHLFVADGQPARMRCGTPPPGWQRPELDDRDWSARNTVVERRDGGAPIEADTIVSGGVGASGVGASGVGASDGGVATCSGARFARWHFTVGSELPS